MSEFAELIEQLCPNGVEYASLGSLGRRNKGTPITASRMRELHKEGAPIRIFAGGKTMADFPFDALPEKNIIFEPSIIVKSRGNIDFEYYDKPFSHKNELWSYTIQDERVIQKFVYYYLLTQLRMLQNLARATSVKLPQLSTGNTDNLKIPIPPIEVQKVIVNILDKFTQLEAELSAELGARREQYAIYRQNLMSFDDEVEVVKLGELIDFINAKPHEKLVDPEGNIALITSKFVSTQGRLARRIRSENVLTPAFTDDIALVMSDLPNGRALARAYFVEADDKYAANQRVCLLRTKNKNRILPKFLYYSVDRNKQLLKYDSGFDQTHLKKDWIVNINLHVPPIKEQMRIVEIFDAFEELITSSKHGILAEKSARLQQYEYYRTKLLTFKELPA